MPFVSPHTAIGLNTDDDQAVMPPGDYRWLENGRVGKSQQENAGTVENILGMLELSGDEILTQTQIVGWKYSDKNNEIYLLGGNVSKANQAIYYIRDPFVNENPVVTKLLQSEHLGISSPRNVWSITITGDDLIYTTREGEIRLINIQKAKDGGYDTAGEEEFLLMKRGPAMAPTVSRGSDPEYISRLDKSKYRFAFRYVYERNQFSVLSPWSFVEFNKFQGESTYIIVSVNETTNSTETVPADVEKIQWLVRVDTNTEWQIIDETYPQVDGVAAYSIDYTGDVIGLTLDNNNAYKFNDAVPRDVIALEFMKNRLFLANYKTGYDVNVTSTDPVITASVEQAIFDDQGFGFSSDISLAVQFYDQQGRPSGAFVGEKVSTPRLVQRGNFTDPYYINWAIDEGVIEIPEWAYSYQILRSDNTRKSFWLHCDYPDAFFMLQDEDGNRTWGKNYNDENWDYLMLDITNFTVNGIGYQYSDGDRVEFYLQGTYYDKSIEFVDGKFIAIPIFYPGASFSLAQKETDSFIIYSPLGEQQETTFHETGYNYEITNPGSSTRAYSVISGQIKFGDTYYSLRDVGEYSLTGYSDTDPYANDFDVNTSGYFQKMNYFDDNYAIWVKGLGRASVINEGEGEQQSIVTVRYSEEKLPDSTVNNLNKFNTLDRYDRLSEERTQIVKLTRAGNRMIANHLRNTSSLYINEGFVKVVEGSEFLAKSSGVITDDRWLSGGFGCVPETVCEFEGRMWWADPYQNHIVRYTANGTQSITDKGYKVERLFKEILKDYDWSNNFIEGSRIQGVPWAGYDPEFNEYFITFPGFFSGDPFQGTLAFSEETQRWVGEYDYAYINLPQIYFRTKYKSFAAHRRKIYEFHNEESPGYNNFFGDQKTRKLKLVVNPEPKAMKVWNNVWLTKIDLVSDEFNDPVIKLTNKYGQEAHIYPSDFINSEGIWKAPVYFDRNTANMTAEYAQRNGDRMRSEWVELEIESDLTTLDAHVLTQVLWKQSEFTR